MLRVLHVQPNRVWTKPGDYRNMEFCQKLRVLTLGFCQGGGISWSFYIFVLFKNLFRIIKWNKLQNWDLKLFENSKKRHFKNSQYLPNPFLFRLLSGIIFEENFSLVSSREKAKLGWICLSSDKLSRSLTEERQDFSFERHRCAEKKASTCTFLPKLSR